MNRDPHVKRDDHTRLVILMRLFAFFLLNSAPSKPSKHRNGPDRFRRNFKIALKSCRFCLDAGHFELAQKVLEESSEYITASKSDSPLMRFPDDADEDDEHRSALHRLVTEFYLLQMTHAWKIGKFDAAEHHYNKIHVSQLSGSASLAEKAADLYYEAGKSLAQKNLHDTAIVWLERAISALDACESEDQSQDAGELRLAITSSLGLCLCHQSLGDSTNTAQLTVYFDMAIRII